MAQLVTLSDLFSTSSSCELERDLYDDSILMKVCFTVIAIAGIFGNGLVLFVFYKNPELKIFTNILIGHQSLIDLISSCILVLTFLLPSISLTQLSQRNLTLANVICKIWVNEFFFWAVNKVSSANLVFLTLERYFAVVYPLIYRRKSKTKVATTVCVVSWISGFLAVIYFPIIFNVSEAGKCTERTLQTSGRRMIAVVSITTTLVIPVVVMLYVYTSILRTLRPKNDLNANQSIETDDMNVEVTTSSQAHEAKCHLHDPPRGRMKTARERRRQSVLTTMFLVCITYVICWTPNQILYFHYNFVSERTTFTDPIHRFSILLAASNAFLNPIIYAFKYRSFQKGLQHIVNGWRS